MKNERSMDDAILAAKQLRRELSAPRQGESASRDGMLHVVDTTSKAQPDAVSIKTGSSNAKGAQHPSVERTVVKKRTIWVRHTIGLRDSTSLALRDAAEAQKKKERHGLLPEDAPRNEQEIADLGIQLALAQLGYA